MELNRLQQFEAIRQGARDAVLQILREEILFEAIREGVETAVLDFLDDHPDALRP